MLNLKRKAIAIAILAIPAALASAQSNSPDSTKWSEQIQRGFFGSPVQSRPDSTIKVSSATGAIYVDHFKTARIENDKGQSFSWHFDPLMSLSNFPLKLIAPAGFDAGNTQVVILHPGHHTGP